MSRTFDAIAFVEMLLAESAKPDPSPDYLPQVRTDQEPSTRPDDLPAEWRVWFEERAAVREYDGGQAREHAEAEALRETIDAMRAACDN